MRNVETSAQERMRAENIRLQYVPRKDNGMKQLQKLDRKVKAPGRILACILAVAGALVMGTGMSLVMVWANMKMGLALGIPGMIAVLLAYPAYALVTNGRKKRYAAEIACLADGLMRGKGETAKPA